MYCISRTWALDVQVSYNWISSPYTGQLGARYTSASGVESITWSFLACQSSAGGTWTLYLQTGSDTPAGQTCAVTQLTGPPLSAPPPP